MSPVMGVMKVRERARHNVLLNTTSHRTPHRTSHLTSHPTSHRTHLPPHRHCGCCPSPQPSCPSVKRPQKGSLELCVSIVLVF